MTAGQISRRRVIGVTAAAAGMALVPLSTVSEAAPARLRRWRGSALGAEATLQVHHPDPAAADRLIARCVDEVRRLEGVFSLYREDSALSVLNRQGVLRDPPTDLVRLLAECGEFSRLTAGAFDATVQPLWRLYADHFARPDADPLGPSDSARAAALAQVGHDRLQIESARVAFARAGMGVTLNGIAQGYITDRVAELLRDGGVETALIDMGEIRALGSRPTGEPWRVGLEDPRAPGRVAEVLTVSNLAVATSGGYGTRFDAANRFEHILDPRSGAAHGRYLGVSVVAPRATTADALSTAFSLMPLDRTEAIVRKLGVTAHFTLADGSRRVQAGSSKIQKV